MIRFTTASGAVYLYDKDNGRVQRQGGPMNSRLRLDNGTWADLDPTQRPPDIAIGQGVFFALAEGYYRATTPVTHIEEN